MEIQGHCVFDYPTIEALTHLSSFKKANPFSRLFFSSSCVVFVFALDLVLYFTLGVVGSLTYLVILSFLLLLLVFVIFFMPMVKYKSLGHLQGSENHYFFSDDGFRAVSYCKVHQGQSVYNYNMLVKAYESSAYLFLFIAHNQVLIVDKRSISGGSMNELRDRLSYFLGKKYYFCKY